MIRTVTRLSFPVLLLMPCLRAAEPSPAVGIAATVIRERAQQMELAGHSAVAGELRSLAKELAAGQVSLADAALVVQIALAGTPTQLAAPTLTPKQREDPTVAAAKATALLDGVPPAPVSAPMSTPVTASVAAPTTVLEEKAPAIQVATNVLAAQFLEDSKTWMVMINAGNNQKIVRGQRLQVKRGDKLIVAISASQVKEMSSICLALSETLTPGEEIKPGDQVVSE
jgi:hypothetical protein